MLICHATLRKGQSTLLTGATTITSKHVLYGLKQKRDRLVSSFLQKKAPDFIFQHAMLLDDYFVERYEQSKVGPGIGINKNPYAIVALGGYGRQEQCIHSDIDLLFLFKKEAIHLWCAAADHYTGQLPALKSHSPAAVRKILFPGNIIVFTLMAVNHRLKFSVFSLE